MGTLMSDILLSAFNTLFRLEGDLDNHCQAIANNRDSIQDLSKQIRPICETRLKLSDHENNLKQQLPLSIFHLSIYASYLHDEQIDRYITKFLIKSQG